MSDIGIVSMAHALSTHAAARQGHIARNVANADTPGYRATDLQDFASTLDDAGAMRATRPGHVGAGSEASTLAEIERFGATSPNGNNVSIEMEMMKGAEVRQQHDMALSVYSTARDILKTALGRGR